MSYSSIKTPIKYIERVLHSGANNLSLSSSVSKKKKLDENDLQKSLLCNLSKYYNSNSKKCLT